MAKFLFSWSDDDEDGNLLIVSEKSYFLEEGAMNDSYEEDVYEELNGFLESIGCFEVTESTYEITSSVALVTRQLMNSGLFESLPEFDEFLDN